MTIPVVLDFVQFLPCSVLICVPTLPLFVQEPSAFQGKDVALV